MSQDSVTLRLSSLTREISRVMANNDESRLAEELVAEIGNIIAKSQVTDTLLLSDSYYLTGYWYLSNGRYPEAIERFSASAQFRELAGVTDLRYALCLSNSAVAYFRTGDYPRAYDQGIKALETRRSVSGNDSSSLAGNYLNLASICLEMNESGKAIVYAEAGLELARSSRGKVSQKVTADLYQTIGLSFYRNSEFTKSLVYCREALKLYESSGAGSSESKQLILNTMSQIYKNLDQPAEAEDCFRKGLSDPDGDIEGKYLLYINYADFLAERGRVEEGEKVLDDGLASVLRKYGPDSREYCLMLASRAFFAQKSSDTGSEALKFYDSCLIYVEKNPWDLSMKKYVLTDYARTLSETGQPGRALEMTDSLLASPLQSEDPGMTAGSTEAYTTYDIKVLMIRYRALKILAGETGEEKYLMEAVKTGRIISVLFDRQRLEMSEEESRTTLSASSRELYTGIIDDYIRLYRLNHDLTFLEGAFEFSERGKVAGFLASMREVNAAKFSLPDELVARSNSIRENIGLYRELITNEKSKVVPDSQKIVTWESVTFGLLRSGDSLMQVFEQSYPSYYSLKIRSDVTKLGSVTEVIGGKANLLSYVLTENKLYIFVTNKRHKEVITCEVDTSFYSSLGRFRTMLTTMPGTSGVRQAFNDFMDLGYELYQILLMPAEKYLLGDRIVISPDNILSYLPFETLLTEEFRSPELLYREAPFALKKYRFSYIYSATLSSETMGHGRSLSNRVIAFAPTYEGMEINDTLLRVYPDLRGGIRSLPYAMLETEDVVSQCGGKAFIGENATEQAYKSEACNYDLIHLAMHTLINDNHPAFSKMIFNHRGDGPEDGLLNTYEVYNVPVKAMMVVLSSCNTGVGKLVTGEGILSLARGFLFAGSRSVIMSMWAVEDYSASAVIKSFYKNLRGGQTKSEALRSARLKFLRSADQARSHPYYWSALVIYGDDSPLWFDRLKLYSALLVLLLTTAILVATVYKSPRS